VPQDFFDFGKRGERMDFGFFLAYEFLVAYLSVAENEHRAQRITLALFVQDFQSRRDTTVF
jgi:hypothetical protein